MKGPGTRKGWALKAAATTAASVMLVLAGAVAATAAPAYHTLAATNVRLGASTSTVIVTTLPLNTPININCYIDGQNISGTTIWDHLADGSGYVSDSLVYTGSNQPVVPRCGNAGPVPGAGYDRNAAVAFARDQWNSAAGFWTAADCTNFASRVLVAGGLHKTREWTDSTTDRSLAFSSTFYWTGVPTKDWQSADYLKNYLVSETHQATITQIDINTLRVPGAEPGDLIMYIWNDGTGPAGVIQHTAVVTDVAGNQTKVTQHDPNAVDKGWNWSTNANAWVSQAYPHAAAYLIHLTV